MNGIVGRGGGNTKGTEKRVKVKGVQWREVVRKEKELKNSLNDRYRITILVLKKQFIRTT